MKATCCLWLYKYGPKKITEKTFPVKLRVTFYRKVKYYYLGIRLTDNQFSGLFLQKQLKSQYQELSHYLTKAEVIIDDLREEFEWSKFENLFFSRNKESNNNPDIFTSIERYVNQLEKEGRIKSLQSHTSTLNHLKKYYGNKRLLLSDITPDWLKDFHKYLAEKGKKTSTISIYMRNIRTIFNQEIGNNNITAEIYPFGKKKYRPPASKGVKKALNISDVTRIFNFKTLTETERWARDMWIFSYLANGMNIKDIAFLKYQNITDDEIHFVRAKTMYSTIENQRSIQIHFHDELKKIIANWGNPDQKPSHFIFDILHPGDLSPMQVTRDVNQAVKVINKYMKRIGRSLGLERQPTCMFARHTYSTVLKRANVPIEMISESLGHTSIKTTEIYLDSFENDRRAEISKLLLPQQPATSESNNDEEEIMVIRS
jgi:integrase/recombinase XerD